MPNLVRKIGDLQTNLQERHLLTIPLHAKHFFKCAVNFADSLLQGDKEKQQTRNFYFHMENKRPLNKLRVADFHFVDVHLFFSCFFLKKSLKFHTYRTKIFIACF